MAEEIIQKQMTLLPEYQEKFLKDLLANIYQVDEETGTITGIAATSPLYGTPVMDPDTGEQMYQALDGTYTSDINQAQMDQYGNPVLAVEGGVAAPDIIRFTEPQVEAIQLAMEQAGTYQPFIDRAEDVFDQGVTTLEGTTGAYDPTSYKDYYDPFVEEVIDTTLADIRRQSNIERGRIGAEGVSQGAFGGSRQAVAEQELFRNTADQMARTGAQLRSAAYTGAQQQAQSAFENQMKRGQNAAQLFQGLGTGIGALGEAAQALGQKDVNALFNIGQLEQQQLQREYDVQRAGQLEEAYEPFARFSYMRDILSGIPSSGTSLAASATPTASPLANVMTNANLASGQNIFGGLGSLMNPSGA
jgi:hypothetical protein